MPAPPRLLFCHARVLLDAACHFHYATIAAIYFAYATLRHLMAAEPLLIRAIILRALVTRFHYMLADTRSASATAPSKRACYEAAQRSRRTRALCARRAPACRGVLPATRFDVTPMPRFAFADADA